MSRMLLFYVGNYGHGFGPSTPCLSTWTLWVGTNQGRILLLYKPDNAELLSATLRAAERLNSWAGSLPSELAPALKEPMRYSPENQHGTSKGAVYTLRSSLNGLCQVLCWLSSVTRLFSGIHYYFSWLLGSGYIAIKPKKCKLPFLPDVTEQPGEEGRSLLQCLSGSCMATHAIIDVTLFLTSPLVILTLGSRCSALAQCPLALIIRKQTRRASVFYSAEPAFSLKTQTWL